ncbi:hypothetical protein MUN84_12680 [Hymenobacter sp. 5516J-16]|uniref:DUF2157 domain-containing protein n=1 Tax=Hymenobacter sublimis TaxID=2933777 RepID=A0ABY4JBA2_9BACT|nr:MULTISPECIES: hypothetical protein [Hymenobacter]UOQ75544.1 hypothetical protein MUN84_12680 [Hymenobacter sp. 5516J-16]UPL49218.1 hypothetical protein MWH26_18825 [Hymenobacter sublimis]
MAEDFAAKMSRKTDAELRDYVANRYQYREEAVLAALEELAQRGMPEPGAASIIQELQVSQQVTNEREQAAREREAENELARRRMRGDYPEEAEETGPALYSPSTITIFSVLFSMAAGGVLLALNLRALRRFGKSWLVIGFVVAYVAGTHFALQWLQQQYGNQYMWLGSVFNIVAIVLYNVVFWPRYIGLTPYRSRPWGGALLVCGLITLVYAILYVRFGLNPTL